MLDWTLSTINNQQSWPQWERWFVFYFDFITDSFFNYNFLFFFSYFVQRSQRLWVQEVCVESATSAKKFQIFVKLYQCFQALLPWSLQRPGWRVYIPICLNEKVHRWYDNHKSPVYIRLVVFFKHSHFHLFSGWMQRNPTVVLSTTKTQQQKACTILRTLFPDTAKLSGFAAFVANEYIGRSCLCQIHQRHQNMLLLFQTDIGPQ